TGWGRGRTRTGHALPRLTAKFTGSGLADVDPRQARVAVPVLLALVALVAERIRLDRPVAAELGNDLPGLEFGHVLRPSPAFSALCHAPAGLGRRDEPGDRDEQRPSCETQGDRRDFPLHGRSPTHTTTLPPPGVNPRPGTGN